MADTNKVVQKADERWHYPALISFLAVPPRGAVDGAMQAQDYLQALWAIGLRMQNATVASIEPAIVDRQRN